MNPKSIVASTACRVPVMRECVSLINNIRAYGLYTTIVSSLMRLPDAGLHLFGNMNASPTCRVIELCKELGITPKTLIDAGACESQWAHWIVKEWPDIRVVSIEPCPTSRTIGEVIKAGLSNSGGVADFSWEGRESHVNVVRFDSLPITIARPSILKIDCEEYTYRAMLGFGKRLREFDVVVVEMWNGDKNDQASIWRAANDAGLQCARVIDVGWLPRKIALYDIAFYRL